MMKNSAETFFVSIVVISKDRHELLLKSVAALRALDYPPESFEIIVVEEGDSPRPPDGVKYVFLPRKNLGLGYARNKGVDQARGGIIAFTDDDVLVDGRWLNELVGAFNDPEVYGAAGLTRAQDSSLLGETEEIIGVPGGGIRWLLISSDKIVPIRNLSACNCAYRREVFSEFRFKEEYFSKFGAEDWYLAAQVLARHKCVYNPKAVVHHKPRANIGRLISTFYRREICQYLIETEVYGKNKSGYFAAKGAGIVAARAVFSVLVFLLAGPGYFFALFALYYGALLVRDRLLWPYVRRKRAFFLVPFTLLITHIGILKAELDILFSKEDGFVKILEKF